MKSQTNGAVFIRALRAARRCAGLCPECGGRPTKGKVLCRNCRQRALLCSRSPKARIRFQNREHSELRMDYNRERNHQKLQSIVGREYLRALGQHRKARKLGNGGSWTAAEWSAMLKKYGHRCLACGLGETQLRCLRRKLVPDHVRALAKGGRNDIGNLQPLCHGTGGCNNRKGIKHIDYRRRVR